jgi:predicted nucleotidyltransferase
MGSVAYGVSNDLSDFDLYSFCVPPKEFIFPHLNGHIAGFGKTPPGFDNWQRHHLIDADADGGKGRSYDLNTYSIVHYFNLCMDCNPNMIDSLFTPRRCILYTSPIGELVRENRHLFLHKGAWHRFKGYSYSQMQKAKSQTREGKRKELVVEFGYDVKFAYHVVRLLGEIEQILIEGTLDLERNSEQLKAIRRGDWTLEQIQTYFADKEKHLEELYIKSELPKYPDEEKIKQVLVQCLEMAYDDIRSIVVTPDASRLAVEEIKAILAKHRL